MKMPDWEYLFLEYGVPIICGFIGAVIGMVLFLR